MAEGALNTVLRMFEGYSLPNKALTRSRFNTFKKKLLPDEQLLLHASKNPIHNLYNPTPMTGVDQPGQFFMGDSFAGIKNWLDSATIGGSEQGYITPLVAPKDLIGDLRVRNGDYATRDQNKLANLPIFLNEENMGGTRDLTTYQTHWPALLTPLMRRLSTTQKARGGRV